MPRFSYKFLDAKGRVQQLESLFSNEQQVYQSVEQQGGVVLKLKPLDQSGLFNDWLKIGIKVDWLSFTKDWVALLEAGLTIIDSLQTLAAWQLESANKSSSYFSRSLQGVLDGLEQGLSLADAWATVGLQVPETWLLSLRLGQQTGQLVSVLRHWLALQLWQKAFQARLKKLLVYPLIALSVLMLVLVFMLLWVLPGLIGFLIDMQAPINLATQSMYALSILLSEYPLWLISSLSLLILLVIFLFKKFGIKYLPYLGRVRWGLERAKLLRQLNWLLKSGMSLHDAIAEVANNTQDKVQKQDLTQLHLQLANGVAMPAAMQRCLNLPAFCEKLFKLAEKTGQLTLTVEQLAEYFEGQAKQQLDQIEPWIEPITTLVLGFIVVWMILAILGPIYEMMANAVF